MVKTAVSVRWVAGAAARAAQRGAAPARLARFGRAVAKWNEHRTGFSGSLASQRNLVSDVGRLERGRVLSAAGSVAPGVSTGLPSPVVQPSKSLSDWVDMRTGVPQVHLSGDWRPAAHELGHLHSLSRGDAAASRYLDAAAKATVFSPPKWDTVLLAEALANRRASQLLPDLAAQLQRRGLAVSSALARPGNGPRLWQRLRSLTARQATPAVSRPEYLRWSRQQLDGYHQQALRDAMSPFASNESLGLPAFLRRLLTAIKPQAAGVGRPV